MASSATSLDYFYDNVCTQDTRKRTQTHPELVAYLKDHSTSLACEDFDKFVDGLNGWISSSNYKVRFKYAMCIAPSHDIPCQVWARHMPFQK